MLAHPVAGPARCSAIDRAAASTGVLCHVGRDAALAQFGNALARVIVLVASQCLRMEAAVTGVIHQVQSCLALGGSGRVRQLKAYDEPIAVLHEHVPGLCQMGLFTPALLGQARFGIGGALVRCVRTLLAVEVDRRVARIIGRLIRRLLIVGLEAFRLAAASISVPSTVKCWRPVWQLLDRRSTMSFELDVATHKSLPRAAQLYVFDERPCNSPFVEKVWRTRGVLARGFDPRTDGTRRSAEARLTFAGRLSVYIRSWLASV